MKIKIKKIEEGRGKTLSELYSITYTKTCWIFD